MSVSRYQEKLLTLGFSLVRQSRVLETRAGSALFQAAYFYYKRHLEDNLQDLVSFHPEVLGNAHVLDIGANIGYTASVLARAINGHRKVFAFEPEPFNFRLLERAAARPAVSGRIVPKQCAVGAEDGSVDLWLNPRHHADHRVITDQFRNEQPKASVKVPLISIDRFLDGNTEVSFVKIDVQGYELPVCQGMVETIKKNPDMKVVLEYSPSSMRVLGYDPITLICLLEEFKFHAYCIHPKGKLSAWSPLAGETPSYDDLLFSRTPIEIV